MTNNTIITIGREFGSGGHEIAEKLANKLDIPFYDKEILKQAAKDSGICEEFFEMYDEKPTGSFLYSLVMDPYAMGFSSNGFELPLNHKVFLAAFDTVKKTADKGPCIFIGRCADYILQEYENCVNIFIKAPMDDRIERITKKYDLDKEKAKSLITKTDKQRASYYNYYSSKKWGNASSYDLIIDSSVLGVDKTAEYLYELIQLKNQ